MVSVWQDGLTMRCLDKMFFELLLLCSRARHQPSPCLNTDMSTAREWYRQGEKCPCLTHRCHGFLTCNIEALCGVLRSLHYFVEHCMPTLELVVFTWRLDHDSATCRAVKMRSTDVVDSQNLHFSKCQPVASHASTEHELETL